MNIVLLSGLRTNYSYELCFLFSQSKWFTKLKLTRRLAVCLNESQVLRPKWRTIHYAFIHYVLMHYVLNHVVYEFYKVILTLIIKVW